MILPTNFRIEAVTPISLSPAAFFGIIAGLPDPGR